VRRWAAPSEAGAGPRSAGIASAVPGRRSGTPITRSLLNVALTVMRLGPGLLLLALLVGFALTSDVFLTSSNLRNILSQSCVVGALALGMLPIVLTRSLDLSVSSTLALSTVICAKVYSTHPGLGALIIPLFLAVGLGVGLVNAILIVRLGLNVPLIVTLGTLYAFQSLAYVVSGGATIVGMPPAVVALSNTDLFGLPIQVTLVAACGVVMAVFLRCMAWGRWIYAIGGSPDAATRVGIPVRAVLISTYLLCGMFAGVAGMMVASASDAGYATAGGLSNLDAIAAVVIGGASLYGGRGGVLGTLVGAIVLGTVYNGLVLANVSPDWTPFAVGAILIFAVGLDVARSRLERIIRLRQALLQSGDA
jgi:ribose transport system permease protein